MHFQKCLFQKAGLLRRAMAGQESAADFVSVPRWAERAQLSWCASALLLMSLIVIKVLEFTKH